VSEAKLELAERGNLTARAALASTSMALFLIAAKTWAAIHTSSMAMLGSLADSGLDLIASLVVLLGVRIAAQPADTDHRWLRSSRSSSSPSRRCSSASGRSSGSSRVPRPPMRSSALGFRSSPLR
jgi:cation efflux family protein